jgi:hypothetical protein
MRAWSISEGEKITETRRNFIADSGSAFGSITAWFFTSKLTTTEDGWIVAECPALPGCVSQDKDHQEAPGQYQRSNFRVAGAEDQKAARNAKAGEPAILVTV